MGFKDVIELMTKNNHQKDDSNNISGRFLWFRKGNIVTGGVGRPSLSASFYSALGDVLRTQAACDSWKI